MNYKKTLIIASISTIVFTSASTALAEFNSMLAPTEFSPVNYIMPKYDAFDHDYYRPPTLKDDEVDTPPIADFTILSQQQGFTSADVGTTKTEFSFDASASTDNEDDGTALEARWNFDNDGTVDSYFSRNKRIQHTFSQPGTYEVKLEILDSGGMISSITKPITIVESTPPQPFFLYGPKTGTEDTVFQFDTRFSRDDQYQPQVLEYRFDWNGDNTWDTPFENKTNWNHRFGDAGTHHVIMEARDPSGETATISQNIVTTSNTTPIAAFTITAPARGQQKTYIFDASMSSDEETPHNRLQYRWDFNYDGKNDIVTDSTWSTSDHYSGTYYFPGQKTVRLEVKDESGAISYAYATIEVTPEETVMDQYQRYLVPST